MTSIRPWLLAIRPKTLSASFVPIILAAALCWQEQRQIDLWILSLTLACTLLIQIATNLFNDAIDHKKGADTSERLGPQRVTASGLIPGHHTVKIAVFTLILAAVCAVPLILHGGWPIVMIGLVSILLTYLYTGGPYALAYLGLGDFFVILFFGLIALMGTYYLLTLSVTWSSFVAGLQVGFLSTVLIAINNLRDVNQDKLANKRTLAVRFGKDFVRCEIAFLIAASYGLGIWWFLKGELLAALLPLTLIHIASYIVRGVFQNEPSSQYNEFLSRSALFQVAFVFQVALGLVIH